LAWLLATAVSARAEYLIGHRLIGLNYQQYQKEAISATAWCACPTDSQSIAFYRGENGERGRSVAA